MFNYPLFSTEGTLTRYQYLMFQLASFGIMFSVSIIEMLAYQAIAFAYLIGLVVAVANVFVTIRRFKDAGVNPWATLGLLIPFVSFIVFLACAFIPTASIEQSKTLD